MYNSSIGLVSRCNSAGPCVRVMNYLVKDYSRMFVSTPSTRLARVFISVGVGAQV